MDNRKFVEAVRWIARTGVHWRELPESFAAWNSVFQRHNRWSNAGVWERVFRACSGHPDIKYVVINSTIIRTHQHRAGAEQGGSGDGSPCHSKGRIDDENPHSGRWPRQSPALYPNAGTDVGLPTGRTLAARHARSPCHCPQGMRQPQDR